MELTFTFAKITVLAFVNSLNPCQIAMLVMVLITILIENPEKRKKIFLTGLSFISAVYIGYLFYGLILIQLFQTFATTMKQGSLIVKYVFSILAMIVGALNIKDYFIYNPGGVATEMPLSIRPKARLAIKKITSPLGAFFAGFIITLFLAPCTLTPYIVATQALSQLGLIKALPWLLYFNLIVILPMFIITIMISAGFATTENISNWKERSIKKLHLIAGILLLAIGFVSLIGWL